jgi:hypothetical protein
LPMVLSRSPNPQISARKNLASSRVKMLTKNFSACLPVQDLNGRDFGGLLSRIDMHALPDRYACSHQDREAKRAA